MKTDPRTERIYELVEQFNFNELDEKEKEYVLSFMNEKEYNELRQTIKDTISYLDDAEDILPHFNPTGRIKKMKAFGRFVSTPISLYKVAAIFVIALSILSLLKLRPNKSAEHVSIADSIIIHTTDTVFLKIIDTLKVYREKPALISFAFEKKENALQEKSDCNRELCPDDIDIIKNMALNNSIIHDSLLKEFVMDVN